MNPCRLYIHLAFTYSVGPSSIVQSELGPAPPFPPIRVLEVQWSWAFSLTCEVAFNRVRLPNFGFEHDQDNDEAAAIAQGIFLPKKKRKVKIIT